MFQPVPECRRAQLYPQVLGDSRLKLGQGQVLLFLDPGAQRLVVLLQARAAIATPLLGFNGAGGNVLLPEPFDAALGHPK